MNEKNSLENFVESYIAAKKKENKRLGFSDWLKQNSVSTPDGGKLKSAAGELLRAQNTYGKTAEKLGTNGMLGSGYEKRLAEISRAKAGENFTEAKASLSDKIQKAKTSYQNYLSKNAGLNARIFRSTVNSIKDSSITDYDTAYFYAIGAGLSENDAKAAATAATDAVKKDLKVSISKSIISKKLTELEAREYATTLGFSKDEIEEIAAYAKRVNELIGSGDISYEDYLKYLENKE